MTTALGSMMSAHREALPYSMMSERTQKVKGLGRAILGSTSSPVKVALSIAGTAGSMIGFYHGYKRNNGSFLWGLWWFVMSGFFWPITLTYAYAQGFAKPIKSTGTVGTDG